MIPKIKNSPKSRSIVRPSLLWPALATLITAIALMCFVSTAHGATFSNTVDTDIYLYYGHGSVTDQQNAPGVWDDGGLNYYKGVCLASEQQYLR